MDITCERRFQGNLQLALKKKLDALHYAFPLSLESCQLVERLLGDLLKTTEGFQQIKKANAELKVRVQHSLEQVEPLKRETSRLLQQNNDLHLEIMHVREDCETRENTWRATVKKLEGENYDLKFLVQKSKQSAKKLDMENSALRQKLDLTLSKMYLPSQFKGIPHAKRTDTNSIGNTQSFEVSRQLNNDSIGNPQAFQRQHAEWANELRIADERGRRWQEELQNINEKKQELEREIENLKAMLLSRDSEIKRISNVIQDFNVDKLTAQYKEDTNSETIKSLNQRIDFLNRDNLRLDADLLQAKKQLKKSQTALEENQMLVDRVNQLRAQNMALQRQIEQTESQNEQVNEAQNQEKAQLEINELRNMVSTLKKELTNLNQKTKKSSYIQAAYNSDKKAYNETIEMVSTQMMNLKNQVNNYQLEVEELNRQNERLVEEVNFHKIQSQNYQKQLEMLKQYSNKIKQENQDYSQQAFKLQQNNQNIENEFVIKEQENQHLKHEIKRLENLQVLAEQNLQKLRQQLQQNGINRIQQEPNIVGTEANISIQNDQLMIV